MKKKKYLACSIFVLAFLLFTSDAVAQTVLSDAQINSILNLIASFGAPQETISNVENALRGSETQSAPTQPGGGVYVFNNNLSLGDVDEEVRQLQIALNSFACCTIAITGAGSPGSETQYFGELTKNAVVRFQEFYREDILTPIDLTEGTGFFGPSTRLKINTLLSGSQLEETLPITPTGPTILNISPSIVTDGDTITITGSGFSDNDNTVVTRFSTHYNVPSDNGSIEIELVTGIPESAQPHQLPLTSEVLVFVNSVKSNEGFVTVLGNETLPSVPQTKRNEYRDQILEALQLPESFFNF